MLATLFPFAAFAFLMMVSTATISLAVAATLSLALAVADVVRGRSAKAIPITAAAVFAALALYVALVDGEFSAHWIRASINGALLAMALASMAMRAPFTLQYARETVDAQTALRPEFLRVNYLLTAVWSLAFIAMLAADLVSVLLPWLPLWIGIAAAFVARNAAAAFTQWYSKVRRERAIASAGVRVTTG